MNLPSCSCPAVDGRPLRAAFSAFGNGEALDPLAGPALALGSCFSPSFLDFTEPLLSPPDPNQELVFLTLYRSRGVDGQIHPYQYHPFLNVLIFIFKKVKRYHFHYIVSPKI